MDKHKLVPIEPTREMWAAAGNAVIALESSHHDAISEAVYMAMLKAAPEIEQKAFVYIHQDTLDSIQQYVSNKDDSFGRPPVWMGDQANSVSGHTIPLYLHHPPAWMPIETAPFGKTVLVFYNNSLGKGRIIKARYIERYTEEAGEASIDNEFCDYCEEYDEFFVPEGWYETVDNGHEYSGYKLETGSNPTHWMPLPPPPAEVNS